jgi:crossover junction endodeoxyribonuclease RuvC
VVVLGVDPGIANTGLAVVSRSSKYRMLSSELVKSTPKMAKAERLLGIYEAVSALLETHKCTLVSIEKCYHNKNVSSSQSTGAVIGVVMCASAMMHVPVVEITPQRVKAATGMGGHCDKEMVVKTMSRLLRQKTLDNHVADAAACAIAGSLAA